jgi:hypothetical protein
MDRELAERRDRTFELLVTQGRGYTEVVETITDEFDASKTAVETDISRMNDWLPKLVDELDRGREDGKLRLRELKKNRQRLQQLAADAEKPSKELKYRRTIEQSINTELQLRQSIGLTHREQTSGEKALEQIATGAMRVEFDDDQDNADEADE